MTKKRVVLYKITRIHKQDGYYYYRKHILGQIGHWEKDHSSALKGWECGTFTLQVPISLVELSPSVTYLYFFAAKTEPLVTEK